MADTKGYIVGDWNAYCDYCGGQYLASELKVDYWGHRACPKDFTLPNPQMFVRPKPEKITVPWSRPVDGTTSYQNSPISLVGAYDIGANTTSPNTTTNWSFDITGVASDTSVLLPAASSLSTGVDCIYTISVLGTSSFKVVMGSSSVVSGNKNINPGEIALFQSNKARNTWTRL